MNKQYLSEEEYLKNNAKVKKIGKILLIVGIITLIIGFILLVTGFIEAGNGITNGFGGSLTGTSSIFGSFGFFAIGGFMLTIGMGICGFGGILMLIGHRREITAYTTQQVMPVAKEGLEEMAPTIKVVSKEIAKGIKEGITDGEGRESQK